MITGVVNAMWSKNVNTKYGEKPVTLFSIEGDESTYNLGFGKPEIQEGDEVSLNYTEKYGERQVDKGTMKIMSRENSYTAGSPKPQPAPASSSGNAGGGGKGYSRGNFPLEFTDGQRSILRQHAFTQASEIYRTGVDDEIESERLPDAVDEIISLARKIEMYTSGDELREEMQNV